MFQFFGMAGDYEHRKVARDNYDWGFVSTARVTDGECDYETAVEHKSYNGGKMVIVAKYANRDDAAKGHLDWVAKMTADTLPESLVDCCNSEIQKFCAVMGEDTEHRKRS